MMEGTKGSEFDYMGELFYASTVLQHAQTKQGKEEMLRFLENTIAKKNIETNAAVCVNKRMYFSENQPKKI
jgi:hypothetical protein